MSTLETVYVRRRVTKVALINGVRRTTLPEYGIWTGMVARCQNENHHNFNRYGGRGITVCDRWLEDFANFYADMGDRPSKRHSIDRIDNDGNYEPGNCRWATAAEQSVNKSRSSQENIWTAEELSELRRRFEAFERIEDISLVLGRSLATTRLRAHTQGLRRNGRITRHLQTYPELRPVLSDRGEGAFLAAVSEKRLRAKTAIKTAKAREKELGRQLFSEIINRDGTRNEKMRALRLAGFTLEEIATEFGITRERVRQLQERGFSETDKASRKTSVVKAKNRDRQVDRLAAAWNKASVSAREVFIQQASVDLRSDLPRLGKFGVAA